MAALRPVDTIRPGLSITPTVGLSRHIAGEFHESRRRSGHRPALSDDLSPQFGMIHKALDEAKIAHYGIDGYEADDLIGTLSTQAKEKGQL